MPVETAPSPERTIIDAARDCRRAQRHFYATRRALMRDTASYTQGDVNRTLEEARKAERQLDNLLTAYDQPPGLPFNRT